MTNTLVISDETSPSIDIHLTEIQDNDPIIVATISEAIVIVETDP